MMNNNSKKSLSEKLYETTDLSQLDGLIEEGLHSGQLELVEERIITSENRIVTIQIMQVTQPESAEPTNQKELPDELPSYPPNILTEWQAEPLGLWRESPFPAIDPECSLYRYYNENE